jgi:hypothetical protein
MKSTALDWLLISISSSPGVYQGTQQTMIQLYPALEAVASPYGSLTTLDLVDRDDPMYIECHCVEWREGETQRIRTLTVRRGPVLAFIPRHGEACLKARPSFCQFTSFLYYDRIFRAELGLFEFATLFLWQQRVNHVTIIGSKTACQLMDVLVISLNETMDSAANASMLPLLAKFTIQHLATSIYSERENRESEALLQRKLEVYMMEQAARGSGHWTRFR